MSYPRVVHGPWCNTRTKPWRCQYCNQDIFYFTCDCGSKVFFDQLGMPWPKHVCPEYLRAEFGIFVPSPDPMPVRGGVDNSNSQSKQLGSRTRDIIACNPSRTGDRENGIGVIRELVKNIDIYKKFNLPETSLATSHINRALGSTDFVQITIYVEDFQSLEDLGNYFGYTAIIEREAISNDGFQIGDLVSFNLKSVSILSEQSIWVCRELGLLAR